MHYFKFNIGDYHKKAGRLTMLEHGAYTLLLHACYDREQFPTEQEAIDWTWARSPEEIAAVKFCLDKFFTLEDGRYVQSRISEEIATYRAKSDTNRAIALDREARKRTNREQDDQERTPNHKPITKNQDKTITRKRELICPDDVREEVWKAWVELRKSKRAPVSQVAVIKIRGEADRANISLDAALEICCARGWQGFNADWLKTDKKSEVDRTMDFVLGRADARGNKFVAPWEDDDVKRIL